MSRIKCYIILLFLTTNCATSYKTSELTQHSLNFLSKIEASYQKIENDFVKKTKFVDSLRESKIDLSKAPYAQILLDYSGLQVIHTDLLQDRTTVANFYKKFRELESTHAKIKKGDDNFPLLQDYLDYTGRAEAELKAKFNVYNDKSHQLFSLVQTNSIFIVGEGQLQNYLQKTVTDSVSYVQSLNKRLLRLKKIEPERRVAGENKNLGRLVHMEMLVEQMNESVTTMQQLQNELKKYEVKDTVVGPHLVFHQEILKIREDKSKLSKLSEEFEDEQSKIEREDP